MTTSKLFIYVLFVLPALAQTAFNGTWRLNIAQSRLAKPLVFWVNKGVYDCSGCPGPNIHVEADGQTHPISGWPFDAESVSVVDPRTITITMKKGDKIVGDEIWTVSEDGNTLTLKNTEYPLDGRRPVTSDATFTKIGNAPPGSHAASGSWSIKPSEDQLTWTYESIGDRITMSAPTGVAYDAKLDGHDYPVKGSKYSNSISLKRIDDRTIETTHKRDGKIVSITKITVSADGRKMTLVTTPEPTGETTTAIAEKQ